MSVSLLVNFYLKNGTVLNFYSYSPEKIEKYFVTEKLRLEYNYATRIETFFVFQIFVGNYRHCGTSLFETR